MPQQLFLLYKFKLSYIISIFVLFFLFFFTFAIPSFSEAQLTRPNLYNAYYVNANKQILLAQASNVYCAEWTYFKGYRGSREFEKSVGEKEEEQKKLDELNKSKDKPGTDEFEGGIEVDNEDNPINNNPNNKPQDGNTKPTDQNKPADNNDANNPPNDSQDNGNENNNNIDIDDIQNEPGLRNEDEETDKQKLRRKLREKREKERQEEIERKLRRGLSENHNLFEQLPNGNEILSDVKIMSYEACNLRKNG